MDSLIKYTQTIIDLTLSNQTKGVYTFKQSHDLLLLIQDIKKFFSEQGNKELKEYTELMNKLIQYLELGQKTGVFKIEESSAIYLKLQELPELLKTFTEQPKKLETIQEEPDILDNLTIDEEERKMPVFN